MDRSLELFLSLCAHPSRAHLVEVQQAYEYTSRDLKLDASTSSIEGNGWIKFDMKMMMDTNNGAGISSGTVGSGLAWGVCACV